MTTRDDRNPQDRNHQEYDRRLAEWMGFSDVFSAGLDEVASQLDRIAEITERQAGDAFDHLEQVAELTGLGRLFVGAVPADDHERLVEQHLQALLAGYVRADYLRQALGAMAALLRGLVDEAGMMSAHTIALDPKLRSTALETAERLRDLHETIGLAEVRRRMLGRMNGMEIVDNGETGGGETGGGETGVDAGGDETDDDHAALERR